MPLPIQVENLEEQDITIRSANDPAFDATIRSVFTGDSDELLKLKPFIVIISNHSTRTMVAYTLTWVLKLPRGTRTSHSHYKYPNAVANEFPVGGNEIRPGEQKIVPMSIELDCGRWTGKPTEVYYLKQFADWFKEYSGIRELRISLDAVIFNDGELIGPDPSDLRSDFITYLNAKEAHYRSILKALGSGHSMDDAFRPLEALTANAHPDARDKKRFWRRETAAEIRGLRSRFGDDPLPAIIWNALRKKPFKIYRRE